MSSPGDARHHAREHVLSLLYEADMKDLDPAVVLAALPAVPDPMACELVSGVAAGRGHIDELIGAAAVGWEVDRMPAVDRAILRLATFELLERTDTPVAVIIDEAVELAKEYSTDASPGFVNGVLTTVAKAVRPTGA
jgi:transcription antitermination protein NusB